MASASKGPAYTVDKHKVPMKRTVRFPCDGCRSQLTCPITDAGTLQLCPDCGTSVRVPGDAELASARSEDESMAVAAKNRAVAEIEAARRDTAMASAAVVSTSRNRERNARLTPHTSGLGWIGLVFLTIGVGLLVVGISVGQSVAVGGMAIVFAGLIFLGIARLGAEVNRWGNAIVDALRENTKRGE